MFNKLQVVFDWKLSPVEQHSRRTLGANELDVEFQLLQLAFTQRFGFRQIRSEVHQTSAVQNQSLQFNRNYTGGYYLTPYITNFII